MLSTINQFLNSPTGDLTVHVAHVLVLLTIWGLLQRINILARRHQWRIAWFYLTIVIYFSFAVSLRVATNGGKRLISDPSVPDIFSIVGSDLSFLIRCFLVFSGCYILMWHRTLTGWARDFRLVAIRYYVVNVSEKGSKAHARLEEKLQRLSDKARDSSDDSSGPSCKRSDDLY